MIKALIIDDENEGRESLRQLLDEFCPDVAILAQGASLATGAELIRCNRPDVVFMDVDIAGGSGFDLLAQCRDLAFEVVVTSVHRAYAARAFRVDALDFLLKPVDPLDLQLAVRKLRQSFQRSARSYGASAETSPDPLPGRVAIPTMEGYTFLKCGDIIRCAAMGGYTSAHLKDGTSMLISTNIGDIEARLLHRGFFRVHNSHLVNLDHVRQFIRNGAGYIVMSDGSHVDVSRRRKEKFIKLFCS